MSESVIARYSKNLGLLLASLLFVGLLFEGLFRLVGLGPLKSYQFSETKLFEWEPNQRTFTSANRQPFHTNSQGIRDAEIPLEKPEGVYRILVTGDSTSVGYGLANEDTYAKRLERKLNERLDGQRYQVINGATSNYDMIQERIFLEETGVKYEPDVVLVGFSLNDVRLKPGGVYEIQEDGSVLPEVREEWIGRLVKWRLVKKSALLSRLYLIYGSIRFAWPEYKSLGVATPDDLENWKRVMLEYQRMLEIGQEHGFELGVIYMPYRYALDEPPGEVDRPRRKFGDFEATTEAFFIDPFETLQVARREGVDLFPRNDPIHMSEPGMEIVAEYLYEQLVGRGLLGPAARPVRQERR